MLGKTESDVNEVEARRKHVRTNIVMQCKLRKVRAGEGPNAWKEDGKRTC